MLQRVEDQEDVQMASAVSTELQMAEQLLKATDRVEAEDQLGGLLGPNRAPFQGILEFVVVVLVWFTGFTMSHTVFYYGFGPHIEEPSWKVTLTKAWAMGQKPGNWEKNIFS